MSKRFPRGRHVRPRLVKGLGPLLELSFDLDLGEFPQVDFGEFPPVDFGEFPPVDFGEFPPVDFDALFGPWPNPDLDKVPAAAPAVRPTRLSLSIGAAPGSGSFLGFRRAVRGR
jgi:hypothetical protein